MSTEIMLGDDDLSTLLEVKSEAHTPSMASTPTDVPSTTATMSISLPPPSPPAKTDEPKSERSTPRPQRSRTTSSRAPIKSERPSVKPERESPAAVPARAGPQLIGDLPLAIDAAMRSFEEIQDNWYQYGTLGRSRQQEDMMVCDCQYQDGDPLWTACGENSDCINRLTQVECLESECRCRAHCQNQRFQRRQYAKVQIVQTEKKGFGLRAGSDISKDDFIYEYVGEVISNPSFMKRMRDYAQQGIRHFYFMMLQKDEFIDATKKGGIARFANHSCEPNCYVAKWVVGKKVRMGIFAKRAIQKDEELTFNYNVDRYGHDAQPCYCGEPKCVGLLGGKTQTDIGGMDDLYIDALGITEEVEQLSLKGTKKKKSRKLDEDWVPVLKPMLEKDAPKMVNAIRQTSSRKILLKLLSRMTLTEDQGVLRQLTRLRGLSMLTTKLFDYEKDDDVVTSILRCISTWPFANRTKIEDAKIEGELAKCVKSENSTIKDLSEQLLKQWSTLESVYRIPKRLAADEGSETVGAAQSDFVRVADEEDQRPAKRTRVEAPTPTPILDIKPMGFARTARAPHPVPLAPQVDPQAPAPPRMQPSRSELAEIIARAIVEAQPTANEAPPPENDANSASKAQNGQKRHRDKDRSGKERSSRDKERSKDKAKGKDRSKGEPSKPKPITSEAQKEKRIVKLVGAVVVKCMSKYSGKMDHDAFKKHAKDLTHLISEKEKRSASYQSGKLDSLSEEKQAKIKKFVKAYTGKIIKRARDKDETSSKPSTTNMNVTSAEHPGAGDEDGDDEMAGVDDEYNVDDAVEGDGGGDGGSASGSEDEDPPDRSSPVSEGNRASPRPPVLGSVTSMEVDS